MVRAFSRHKEQVHVDGHSGVVCRRTTAYNALEAARKLCFDAGLAEWKLTDGTRRTREFEHVARDQHERKHLDHPAWRRTPTRV
jgi:hypothetical protein